jgi:flagellin
MSINTNMGALMASAASSNVNKAMETSMNRLSTGLRINAAKDDAAGVAIASRLTSEIRGTNQAIRNASDGQALIDTAEGAHLEIVNILQRMREIGIQAANDTNNADDRTNLQAEMNQLTTEIDRIATTTKWAGKSLLDGASPYTGTAPNASAATVHTDRAQFSFQVGTGTTDNDLITANIGAVSATALAISGTERPSVAYISGFLTATPTTANATTIAATDGTAAGSTDLTIGGTWTKGETLKFTLQGRDFSIDTSEANGYDGSVTGVAAKIKDAINAAGLTGISATSTAGVVNIARTSAVSVSSTANAKTAVNSIDAAIRTVNTQRANLGAISNRLDSTVSNLTNISTNLEAGRSSIQDADFAAESTSLAKSQILQQASTAMLAQANASKQGVLQLLQG